MLEYSTYYFEAPEKSFRVCVTSGRDLGKMLRWTTKNKFNISQLKRFLMGYIKEEKYKLKHILANLQVEILSWKIIHKKVLSIFFKV